MNSLTLRKLTDNDIAFIEKWLDLPHVKKWFENKESWLYEIRLRNTEFNFIKHKIILYNNTPIGFCQYYDCYFSNEECYPTTNQNEIYSIDYLIGETEYLRKGYGTKIVQILIKEIQSNTMAKKIMVQPNSSNIASIKTLLSVGMKFDQQSNCYCWKFQNK